MELLILVAIVAVGVCVKVKVLDNLVGGKENDAKENG